MIDVDRLWFVCGELASSLRGRQHNLRHVKIDAVDDRGREIQPGKHLVVFVYPLIERVLVKRFDGMKQLVRHQRGARDVESGRKWRRWAWRRRRRQRQIWRSAHEERTPTARPTPPFHKQSHSNPSRNQKHNCKACDREAPGGACAVFPVFIVFRGTNERSPDTAGIDVASALLTPLVPFERMFGKGVLVERQR